MDGQKKTIDREIQKFEKDKNEDQLRENLKGIPQALLNMSLAKDIVDLEKNAKNEKRERNFTLGGH